MASAIFRITDGDTVIYLLNEDAGIHVTDWVPKFAKEKSNGIFQDSPLSEGRQIVYRQWANPIEAFIVSFHGTSQNNLTLTQQRFVALLEQAKEYWIGSTDAMVWFEMKPLKHDSMLYALVKNYQIPSLDSPFDQPFLQVDGTAVYEDISLTVEREHWRALEPGLDTQLPLSNLAPVFKMQTYNPSANAHTASAYFDYSGGSTAYATSGNLYAGYYPTGSINQGKFGIIFDVVNIPQGATVVEAYMELDSPSNTMPYRIQGIDEDDCSNFASYADLTGRTLTTASTSLLRTGTSNPFLTTSVKDIVQEIVDRPGWSLGNQLGFIIDDEPAIKGYADFDAYADGGTHNLHVKYETGGYNGVSATKTDPVFVLNTWSPYSLTHIYRYDASLTTFSGNLVGATLPYQLLPDSTAAGDIVYFGISDDDGNLQGYFSNIVFNLDPAVYDNLEGIWEYYDGFDLDWTEFGTVYRDETSFKMPLSVDGVSHISFPHWPSNFPGEYPWPIAINSITAYWVRFRVVSIHNLTENVNQQSVDVYTVTQNWVELAAGQTFGDLNTLAKLRIYDRTADPGGHTEKIYVGIRESPENDQFYPVLYCSETNTAPGVRTTIGSTFTEYGHPFGGTGLVWSMSTKLVTDSLAAADTWYTVCSWSFDADIAKFYNGDYRVFVRAGEFGQTTLTFRINVSASGGSTTGEPFSVTAPITPELFNIGHINIDTGADKSQTTELRSLSLSLQLKGSDTSGTVDVSEIMLLPTSLWSGEFTGGSHLSSTNYLQIDSVSDPRTHVKASTRNRETDREESKWTAITNGSFGLLPNKKQRIYVLGRARWEIFTDADLWDNLYSVELFSVDRYLGLRGDN